jgi:hypothetical protein
VSPRRISKYIWDGNPFLALPSLASELLDILLRQQACARKLPLAVQALAAVAVAVVEQLTLSLRLCSNIS